MQKTLCVINVLTLEVMVQNCLEDRVLVIDLTKDTVEGGPFLNSIIKLLEDVKEDLKYYIERSHKSGG